jgi:hypothetical protein
MPASISWWGWLLIAIACWYFQLVMSIRTDKGGKGAWTIRIALITGMVLSSLIGVVRFVKWVWQW